MFKNVMTYLGLGPDEEYDDGYLYDDDDDAIDLDRTNAAAAPSGRGAGRSHESDHANNGYAEGFHADSGASAVSSVRPLRPVPSPELDSDWRGGAEPTYRPSGDRQASGATRVRSTAVPSDTLDIDAEEARSLSSRTGGSNDRGGNDRGDRGNHERGVGDRQRSEVVRPVPIQRTKPRALTPKTFGDAKVLADDIKNSVPVVMNLREADRDLARRLIDFASGVCYSLDASMEKLATQVFLLTPSSVEVSGEERRRIEERGFDR